jgi:hypothetical protein
MLEGRPRLPEKGGKRSVRREELGESECKYMERVACEVLFWGWIGRTSRGWFFGRKGLGGG